MPREQFSGNLFGESSEPEGERREFLDAEGNTVDSEGNLLREKPSEYLVKALEMARREHPEVRPSDELVQFYVRQLKLQEKKRSKKEK